MRTFQKTLLRGAGAVVLAGGLIAPGIAAAAPTADPGNITFEGVDNEDCTATFTVVNTTNSDWAKVNYWTGAEIPAAVPAFDKNEDSELALTADAAFRDGNGDWYAPYSEARGNSDINQKTYVRGLDAVTTTEIVDFSDKTAAEGAVDVAYRMTNPDTKDYDLGMKKLVVTGCGTDGDTNGNPFLGSLDVFGSLAGDNGSLSN